MDLAGKLLAELSDFTPAQLNTLGEQLQRIGSVLVGHSAALSGQPESIEAVPVEEPEAVREEPARSVGRFGAITREIALVRAQELGEFTRPQFSERLGLKGSATSKWLTLLSNEGEIVYVNGLYRCLSSPQMRDWVVRQPDPFELHAAAAATKKSLEDALEELRGLATRGIVESVEDELFQYIPPDNIPSPRERPHKPPPEKDRPSYELARATGMPVRRSAADKATRAQRSTAGAGGVKGFKQRDRRYEEMQAKKEARAEERKAKAQKDPGWKSRNGKRR